MKSNVVLVKKNHVGIRVCTDFQDINKSCTKDVFPLPNINTIVDLTVGYEMLSIMDGFLRYNQINIVEEYQHKTTFTTPCGTFYYQVVPFSLKNASARSINGK